jgi:CheY-like chemotaxis protein
MADILIIDDDDMFRDVLASALEQAGHQVRQATNGIEGLNLFHAQPAELVLTDIVMPEKEGLDTIRDLRREFPQARIIAMSGGLAHDPKLYLHMAEKFGATAVLAKPFQLADLKKAVDAALAH